MPACPKCGEENPERARFCLACGTALVASPTEKREVRKTVTVLFSDVTGSTALGERNDPEAMRAIMERYFDRMSAIIERHGGTVEKFIGDAIMAVFGVPAVHEDDALRAVRAADEMRTALALLNGELERERGLRITVRSGVNTGEVVAGDPSAGQRLITGDAVNTAARLEQGASPSEILLGDATYRLVRDAVAVEPVDPVVAKGKDAPLTAYRLVSVAAGAPGHARRLDAPMVGREHEQSLLIGAFERAVRERGCHLFTILGIAGVGKSRLVGEVIGALRDEATILSGRCLPYGEGITFWPVMEAVTEAAGVRDDDTADEARARIAQLVRGEEHADRIAARVAEVAGLGEEGGSPDEIFWAVRKLFEALARARPLLLVFDDVHWAEPTFLDLVEHIADWSRDAPMLLVCVARPELFDRRAGWSGGKMNATSILLEPLSDKECGQLIEELLGRAELERDARTAITDAAEGNPLFVEEVLSMLIDDGLLRPDDGRWVAAGDLSHVDVPPTIQALIAARIDRLGDDERAVLERASIVGRVFWRGAVVELCPPTARLGVDGNLLTLVRKELVRQDRSTFAGEEAFRFRHLLIRDAGYNTIPKEVRADLHERFARWLENVTGDRKAEYEEVVGYHFEQAQRYRIEVGRRDERAESLGTEAGRRLAEAGRRAAARRDASAAINLLGRAATLLPERDPLRLDLLPDLAGALLDAGEFGRCETLLAEAIDLARAIGNESLEWRAIVMRSALYGQSDPTKETLEESRRIAERAIEVFEVLDDDRGLAKAWGVIAIGHWSLMHSEDTRVALERQLEHASRAGDRAEEMTTLTWLMFVVQSGPTPFRVVADRCKELARQSGGDRGVERAWDIIAGMIAAGEGRFDEGRSLMERGRAVGVDLGIKVIHAASALSAADVEKYAGDLDAAERVLREGYEALSAMGERSFLSTLAGELSQIIADLGRSDEAEEFARIAREAGDPLDAATHILWRTGLAKVRAARGDFGEGIRFANEALKMVDDSDFLDWQGWARVHFAPVFRAAGRVDDAQRLLEEALDRFRQKGVPVMVDRVEQMLAELGRASDA